MSKSNPAALFGMTPSSQLRKLVNFLGKRVDRLGLNDKLDADEMLKEAENKTGLADWGDTWFLEPFGTLIEAINSEAGLQPAGLYLRKMRILQLLRNRLRAEFYFQKYPEILGTTIDRPLVITGLPRTGTTFLQRLIASNSALRTIRFYEGLNPAPFVPHSPKKRKGSHGGTSLP